MTIVREWLSLGGPQQIALNNSMRVMDFVNGVGPRFLNESFGMDNAQVPVPPSTPSTRPSRRNTRPTARAPASTRNMTP